MKTQTAKLNFLKISPRKTRLVADLIKGLPVNEAEAQLLILPNRASRPLLKLLRSAMANAKNNQQMNSEKLLVRNIRVDIGPKQKRWRMRARGSVSPIEKKTCHVTLVLEEFERKIPIKFKFIPKAKKVKKGKPKKKIEKEKQEKPEAQEKKAPIRKMGFMKRIFRRKAV